MSELRERAREVAAVMGKLGCIAFGGPAVHVAMLRDETVRRRGWLDDASFLDLFGAVSILPGTSSTQLAIVLSRRRAGWVGIVLGGAAFIAPAMVIVLGLAWAYRRYGRRRRAAVCCTASSRWSSPSSRWRCGRWPARR